MSSSDHLLPLPAVWDHIAENEPDRALFSIATGSEVQDGYRDITARIMADAIHRAAWFLERELGRSTTFETLCYLGPSDLRYHIILAAASKVGYQTFWTSPRNSFEGHVRLMEATECTICLTPAAIPPGLPHVIEKLQMRHITVPEQDVWLHATEPVDRYLFTMTYEECSHLPFTIIHTSGSTG